MENNNNLEELSGKVEEEKEKEHQKQERVQVFLNSLNEKETKELIFEGDFEDGDLISITKEGEYYSFSFYSKEDGETKYYVPGAEVYEKLKEIKKKEIIWRT